MHKRAPMPHRAAGRVAMHQPLHAVVAPLHAACGVHAQHRIAHAFKQHLELVAALLQVGQAARDFAGGLRRRQHGGGKRSANLRTLCRE